MPKSFHTFFMMLTLGFFLLPMLSHACGIKAEKACCTKEISSKSPTKKCCKESSDKHEKKSCDGKCGHSNCTAASVISIIAVFTDIAFSANVFDFSDEKQQFHDLKTFISSGFSSLWLIPKIG
jgi:hypothetical protein